MKHPDQPDNTAGETCYPYPTRRHRKGVGCPDKPSRLRQAGEGDRNGEQARQADSDQERMGNDVTI